MRGDEWPICTAEPRHHNSVKTAAQSKDDTLTAHSLFFVSHAASFGSVVWFWLRYVCSFVGSSQMLNSSILKYLTQTLRFKLESMDRSPISEFSQPTNACCGGAASRLAGLLVRLFAGWFHFCGLVVPLRCRHPRNIKVTLQCHLVLSTNADAPLLLP